MVKIYLMIVSYLILPLSLNAHTIKRCLHRHHSDGTISCLDKPSILSSEFKNQENDGGDLFQSFIIRKVRHYPRTYDDPYLCRYSHAEANAAAKKRCGDDCIDSEFGCAKLVHVNESSCEENPRVFSSIIDTFEAIYECKK